MRKLLYILFILLMLTGTALASASPTPVDAALIADSLPGYTYVDGVSADDGLRLLMRNPAGELVFIGGVQLLSGQWVFTESTPLPEGTSLDSSNAFTLPVGTDVIRIELHPYADGSWGVSSIAPASIAPKTIMLHQHMIYTRHIHAEDALLGDHPWSDVTRINWANLPSTYDEAVAMLDMTHWAVTSSSNPFDLVHLRKAPDKDSSSLGSYYNRTPVNVLQWGDEWCAVSIGGVEGWMMTSFLVPASSMGSIPSASPVAVPRKLETQLHISPSRRSSYVLRVMEYPDSPCILGKTGYWYHVWLPDTEEFGYVHVDDL